MGRERGLEYNCGGLLSGGRGVYKSKGRGKKFKGKDGLGL